MKVFRSTSGSQATGFVSQARRALASLLWNDEEKSPRRGRLLLEQLESRQMMAADTDMLYTDGVSLAASSTPTAALTNSTAAEGEAAPDLVAFAKALTDAGVKFYGAIWCPFCAEQKALFEDGYKYLNFIEVTNANRSLNAVGIANDIREFPTWEFPDGSQLPKVQTLATLSARSKVAIPTLDKPSFAMLGPIDDDGNAVPLTIGIGSPLNLPVDAYNPSGGPITIKVSVADPELLTADVLTGNRSVRFDMETYGDMVFQLFEQEAPRPAGRMIALANSNFYDGLTFHRVVDSVSNENGVEIIDNFVIQGGDPTALGSGGSTLDNFDDEFNVNLQHNQTGVLSYAKSSLDDTNDSQFFITGGPTRSLDFNHSIFGQLVEGDDVRKGINDLADPHNKGTNSDDKPLIDVKIKSVDVINDIENSVVRLKAVGNRTGSTTVTFTATNADGKTFTEIVPVTVVADSGGGSNSQPFLADIPTPAPAPNTAPVTLQLSSADVEGDAVAYTATSATTGVTATVNSAGLVTVTPSAGFTGNAIVNVAVKPAAGVVGTLPGQNDNEKVTFAFTSSSTLSAPTSVDLAAASDSGSSSTDNITNLTAMTFTVAGVQAGNEVKLFSGNTQVGTGIATGTSINITTNNVAAQGDGNYTITARQFSSTGSNSSLASPGLTVTYDGTQPVRISGFPTAANINTPLAVDLNHAEEHNGLTYSLTAKPEGASIDAATGAITWTPTTAQLGNQSFTLALTDTAGNVRAETFPVVVAGTPLAGFRLEVANTAGTVVTNVAAGDEFLLRVFADDLRGVFDVHGVFSAFTDIMFDSTQVTPVATSPITYGPTFSTNPNGTISAGLINELGAISNILAATDVNEVLVATIRMKAIGTGTVKLVSDAADVRGNEFLLYDQNVPVDKSLIRFGTTDLTIGRRFTAANDTATVTQGGAATTINVLQNDTFTTGTTGTLTVSSVGTPTKGGTATIVNNAITYKPATTFAGTETFTYVATDNTGATQTATVTVNVTATNNAPPTAVADAFPIVEDAAEASFNVRSNDTTADTGETISVSAVGTPSKGGTVRLGTDGASIFYRPAANFSGAETVTYTLLDSRSATATGTVTFTVSAVNDAPLASPITRFVFRSSTATTVATLSDYGTNPDGTSEVLTVALVGTASAGGTFAISGTSIAYTPPSATFTGTDTISYKVTDAGGLSSTGTITLNVSDAAPSDFSLALGGSGDQFLTYIPSIAATLSGTTTSGQAVTRSLNFGGSTNTARFDNLVPGNYQVQIPAIPFLIGMEQPKSVSFVATNAGGSMSDSISVGTLNPIYISIRDFFNNAPKKSIFAVVAPGSDSLIVLGAQSATSTITSPVVSLNQAGDSITIKGKNSTGSDTQATVAAGANSKVETRASASGLRLLKISLEAGDVTFPAPTTSTPTTTAPTTTNTSTNNPAPTGEGESPSANRLTAAPAARAANLFVSDTSNADGEELAAGENAKEDGIGQDNKSSAATAAVDQAFADVTQSLTRVSTTGDALAEDTSTPPAAAAVDELLSSSLM